MSKYQFYYFSEENSTEIPDEIKDLDCKDNLDAFMYLDYETEYLNGIRSNKVVKLIRDGEIIDNEYLSWLNGE